MENQQTPSYPNAGPANIPPAPWWNDFKSFLENSMVGEPVKSAYDWWQEGAGTPPTRTYASDMTVFPMDTSPNPDLPSEHLLKSAIGETEGVLTPKEFANMYAEQEKSPTSSGASTPTQGGAAAKSKTEQSGKVAGTAAPESKVDPGSSEPSKNDVSMSKPSAPPQRLRELSKEEVRKLTTSQQKHYFKMLSQQRKAESMMAGDKIRELREAREAKDLAGRMQRLGYEVDPKMNIHQLKHSYLQQKREKHPPKKGVPLSDEQKQAMLAAMRKQRASGGGGSRTPSYSSKMKRAQEFAEAYKRSQNIKRFGQESVDLRERLDRSSDHLNRISMYDFPRGETP